MQQCTLAMPRLFGDDGEALRLRKHPILKASESECEQAGRRAQHVGLAIIPALFHLVASSDR